MSAVDRLMSPGNKPLTGQVALDTGGGTVIGRAFVTEPTEAWARAVVIASRGRAGAIHVRNMARAFLFALSLDRAEVILEDINLYAGGRRSEVRG